MRRQLTLTLIFCGCATLFACAEDQPRGPAEHPIGETTTPPVEGVSPIEEPTPLAGILGGGVPAQLLPGVIEPIEGFATAQLTTGSYSPAYAVAGQHRVNLSVEGISGEARAQVDSGEWLPLDFPVEVETIAAAGSNDGYVHLAVAGEGAIFYAWFHAPTGARGEPLALASDRSRDATIAIGDETVVLAWTQDPAEDAEPGTPATIVVSRGGLDETGALAFAMPREANPGCCVPEYEWDSTYSVSGPSLALGPDGRIHMLYEWMSSSSTVIDYLEETADGSFADPRPVASAAFSPCPALAVDHDGVHITYLLEWNRDVWYVHIADDGVMSPPRSVYESPSGVALALMVRDGEGTMHLGIKEFPVEAGQGERLLYKRDGGEALVIGQSEEGGYFQLSPRAGGILIEDGDFVLMYERANSPDDRGYIELSRSLVYAATVEEGS